MYWEETKKSRAVFYYILEEEKDGKFPASVYYTDDILYCKGTFSSKEVRYDTRDGYFEYFFRTGKPMCSGSFKNGEKDGFWTIYYSGGGIERAGTYKDNRKSGFWFYYDKNQSITDTVEFLGADYSGEYISIKKGIVRERSSYLDGEYHGYYEKFDSKGNINYRGYYDSGLRVNEWLYYDPAGNIVSKIYYGEKEKIDSVFYFNEDGTLYADRIDTSTVYKHPGIDTVTNIIRHNLTYPSLAVEYGIQGKVMIDFTVRYNGEVENIHCIDDIKLDFGLEEECIRVLKDYLKFRPHRVFNSKASIRYKIPVKFKLM